MAGLLPRHAVGAGRPRFVRAALLGSLVALVLDVLMLSGGHAGLLRDPGLLGGFYDVQARSLLEGHVSVDPEAVGFEGFVIDGNTYVYFGPVPALLRMPVLALTDSLDGRLTQLSMLLAFLVLLGATALLHRLVRSAVRPGAAQGPGDAAGAFLLQLAVGAGAVPLYLASRPVVYHETELWGAALAVAALAAIVGVVAKPTGRRIALAGAAVALAINTRVPAGLGPMLALLAVAAFVAAGRIPCATGARSVGLLAAAALVPLGLSAAVNIAKFGEPFGIPLDKQVFSSFDPNRKAALADNGGSLFGAKFVPTTLVQAVRPDAIGTTRSFPYLGLPREEAPVIGGARFDTIEQSLSAPTSMPLLCVLALVGFVAAARRRALRPLLAVAAATAAGSAVSLTIAYVTTRYLADFLPFLLLGALIGLHVLLERGRRIRALVAGMAVLTLVGVAVNGSVGLVTQRLLSPETTEADRAGFVEDQDTVDDALGRAPHGLATGPELPRPGTPGDLFAIGDCDGLYVAGHSEWLAVERTERTGVRRLTARFPRRAPARAEALATLGSGERRVTVTYGPGSDMTVRAGEKITGRGRLPASGGTEAPVVITFGPVTETSHIVSVEVGGRLAVEAPAPYDRLAALRLRDDPEDRALRPFSGAVRRAASPEPRVCRRLLRRSRVAARPGPRA